MKKRLVGMADSLLARVLPEEQAGACVPEHGQSCGCALVGNILYHFYVNCYGTCAQSSRCYP